IVFCFFFQAEDGIRDFHVTGVQTCALPIYSRFKETSSTSISMDLRWGQFAERVSIMSAHASKGLEFDHVIIGGILTNSANITNRSEERRVGKECRYSWWRDE